MTRTDLTNKTSRLIVISYLLIVTVIIAVLYIITSNLITANSINPSLVQTHTTQLNVDDFDKILKQIRLNN